MADQRAQKIGNNREIGIIFENSLENALDVSAKDKNSPYVNPYMSEVKDQIRE